MADTMLIYIVCAIMTKIMSKKKNLYFTKYVFKPPFLWVTTSVNEPIGHSYQLYCNPEHLMTLSSYWENNKLCLWAPRADGGDSLWHRHAEESSHRCPVVYCLVSGPLETDKRVCVLNISLSDWLFLALYKPVCASGLDLQPALKRAVSNLWVVWGN